MNGISHKATPSTGGAQDPSSAVGGASASSAQQQQPAGSYIQGSTILPTMAGAVLGRGGDAQQQQQQASHPQTTSQLQQSPHIARPVPISPSRQPQQQQQPLSTYNQTQQPQPSAILTSPTRTAASSTHDTSSGSASLSRAESIRSTKQIGGADVSEAVYSFRLLEALRKGDQTALHPFLSRASVRNGPVKELTSPLHLAVRCAEYSTIELCLDYKAASLNAADSQSGNTPLHLAALTGRADVVQLFLRQDDVDDTLRNHEGRDALGVSKTLEVAQLIQVSRAQLNLNFLDTLERWERDAPGAHDELVALLNRPRIGVVDLNAQTRSGTTLLHEAVRRKDNRMIETAVRKGADVFCRNKKGKRVLESTKDEKVKALLQQLSNADAALAAQNSAGGLPPIFRGYLSKWTNAIGGYKTRWFVLENGILSYYHTQEDEGKSSRGSFNLRFAKIRADANDKHRFEIISEPTGAKGQSAKLYLRGSHPVERARWVQVLQQTADFFDLDRTSSRPENVLYSLRSGSSVSLADTAAGGVSSSNVPAGTKGIATGVPSRTGTPFRGTSSTPLVDTVPEFQALVPQRSTTPFQADLASIGGFASAGKVGSSAASITKTRNNRTPSIISRESRTPSDEPILTDGGVASEVAAMLPGIPHEADFGLVANSLRTQVDLSLQLATSLDGVGVNAPVKDALCDALQNSSSLFAQYQSMVAHREAYLVRRYEQEIQAKLLWEENIQTLARQHAEMEEQLHEAAEDNARKRKMLREMRGTLGSAGVASPKVSSPLPVSAQYGSLDLSSPGNTINARRGNSIAVAAAAAAAGGSASQLDGISAADDSGEEDDEFFEAVTDESGTGLSSLTLVDKPLRQASAPLDWPKGYDEVSSQEDYYEPYKHLRDRLPIGKDDRPSMSLWAVLKNNIGKDLTKIAFPVSFNEPTSMLERMAEDMEYSTCLDAAVSQTDSTLRTAFVAAFAMSNYSSTQGRIAKPFNPLLSETFEYVRLDRKYRYISEQVSHHPPTSACLAESPFWEYNGSVDAKNRFSGKSFEIKPTGAAFVNLKVPKEYLEGVATRPVKPVPGHAESVLEHFSWNKVTTVVSGFLMGSITISHEGEMVVTNHSTGDVCRLTFKPRGWRAKDACEIRGTVTSGKTGQIVWDIAGKWTTQLVARRANTAQEELPTDAAVTSSTDELILLWRAEEKPSLPFNLTQFAVTLNSLPPGLEKALPPTDCRLRPDLVAFEHGRFDEANTLKADLEQFQRETRKKREEGQLPPHKPLYFTKVTDEITGEGKWEPVREKDPELGGLATPRYWLQRNKAVKTDDEKSKWTDVPRIFGPYVASRHKDD